MKTFKMLSFSFVKDDKICNIPLVDGIIINQNNRDHTWVLEVFTTNDYQPYFEKYRETNKSFDVQVIITSPDNEPAPFFVKVHSITEIGGKISILMKGTVTERTKYSVELLRTLLSEGLSNEELLHRFEQGMRERPRLKDL